MNAALRTESRRAGGRRSGQLNNPLARFQTFVLSSLHEAEVVPLKYHDPDKNKFTSACVHTH